MHKIETHLHTAYVSKCGWMGSIPIIAEYAQAGYSAIAVTDHYNRDTFELLRLDISKPCHVLEAFEEGYYRLCVEAKKHGILVYKGAELRFDESDNDYLLYGYEPSLLEDPEHVISMGVAEFSKKCREQGAILVQAHPFRKKCSPVNPEYIDGVEVVNFNARHDSRNDLAQEYADKHQLLGIAGSDYHRYGDGATTGIMSATLPKNDREFAELLRSRAFDIIAK